MRRKFKFESSPAISNTTSQAQILNIENLTENNREFKKILWTGDNLQVTLMNIEPNGEIGAEIHENADQFIKIESGRASVFLGTSENNYDYQRVVDEDFAVIIPAGTWHNIVNTGNDQLKLFSIYAPPQHRS